MIEPNNDEVICPKCCHQFRAIHVNVQQELAAANEQIIKLENALKVIQSSMSQAQIVGNDKDREIILTSNIVNSALAEIAIRKGEKQ